MALRTPYLKYFLDDVGHSVHCMNTMAVALAELNSDTKVASGLNISWSTADYKKSSINSRSFAVRSTIVYVVESLYEYLNKICKDVYWLDEKSFNSPSFSDKSKAEKTKLFLSELPGIKLEWVIFAELLCHWRNRVVHANSSSAFISRADSSYLLLKKEEIYESYHHFDVEIALENYNIGKTTLKDVTTLTTFVINCVRAVDDYYIARLNASDLSLFTSRLSENNQFRLILSQAKSEKKSRQIRKFIEVNYPQFSLDLINSISQELSK